jgi:hypothetical protein
MAEEKCNHNSQTLDLCLHFGLVSLSRQLDLGLFKIWRCQKTGQPFLLLSPIDNVRSPQV